MEGFRTSLTGISSESIDLIMNSWSAATKKNYSPYIKAWVTFCKNKGIKMESAINDIHLGIDFLTFLFRSKNLGYSAVNTARSALSTIIITGNLETFGKQPLVSRLLKGMFRERPSLPRYTVTYDVNIVLKYLKTITTKMTFKQLTYKVVMLLCLLTGHRDQSINEIDIKFMHKDENQMVFYIPVMLKNTTSKFHPQPLTLVRYPDESLCVVKHLEVYMDVTKDLRGNNTRLLLSLVPPHTNVTTSTVSRWVRSVLKEAGIDVTTFSSHSTRSAATSFAKAKGLSIDEIRSAAGWANSSTFAKHYNKVIVPNFGNTILKDFQ